ncbi:hypothetical protein SH1V18_39160 [Vallitalea longa]|uniref:Chlorophyllase n=1 Tax=Vallitalea longa TaxID=2936439 RepID=A0A9W5YEW0_9FIRM|nr:hypothetical protein [Vallitalea longa]GKX31436.1 hypothetical protein SH1V18_39160 [Vallitalea longa]
MNKIKRLMSVIVVIMLCQSLLLAGCSKKDEDNKDKNQIKKENNSDKVDNEIPNSIQDKEIEISEYDLGQSEIKQSSGIIMPYDMVGTIAAPKEGDNYPVVFIMHGSHMIEDYNKDRYDLGFKYLVEALAKKGFVAVAFNINAQYHLEFGEPIAHERLINIFNEHFDKLESAIKGDSDDFGIELKNKGDLSNIAMIGHSRGGGSLDAIINDQKDKGNDNVFGIIKVAPSNVMVIENNNPDIPTGIILPQYDGDVSSQDGQMTFDELKGNPLRKSFASLVFLKGAGHNFFNDNVEQDDRENYSNLTVDDKKIFLTREQQKQFLIDYSIDFLNKALGEEVDNNLFDASKSTSNTAYGLQAKTSLITGNRTEILLADSQDSVGENEFGGNNISENVEVKYLTESYIPNKDQLLNFDHPTNYEEYGLFRIDYTNKNGKFMMEIPKDNQDMSNYQAISLYLALYPGSDLNKPRENQALSIVVKDSNGKEAKVILDDKTIALDYPQGKSITNEYTTFWSLKTPLSEARIPLSEFKDIDIKSVASISLLFDQKDSGSIILRDIMLTK